MAFDEKCSALDVDGDEIMVMRVYLLRNILLFRHFLKTTLKLCEVTPEPMVDELHVSVNISLGSAYVKELGELDRLKLHGV